MTGAFLSLLLICLALYWVQRGREWVLPVLVAVHSFNGISLGAFGVPFRAPDVILMILASLGSVRLIGSGRPVPLGVIRGAVFVLLLGLVPLPLGYNFLADVETRHYGFFQQPLARVLFAGLERLLLVVLLLLPYAYDPLSRSRLPSRVTGGYLVGSTIQCGLALYQWIAMNSALPALTADELPGVDVSGLQRLSGLAGEPRHLAMLLVPSIVILFVSGKRFNGARAGLFSWFNVTLHLVVLGLTYSTSGVFLLALAFGGVVVLLGLRGELGASSRVLALLGLLVAGSLAFIDPDIIRARLLDRFEWDFVFHSEFNSAASLELVEAHPIVGLAGVGMGVPAFLIKGMASYEAAFNSTLYDPTFFLRNPPGLLLVVLESGLVGLFTLLVFSLRLVRSLVASGDSGVILLATLLTAQLVTGVVGAPPFTVAVFCGFAALSAARSRPGHAHGLPEATLRNQHR